MAGAGEAPRGDGCGALSFSRLSRYEVQSHSSIRHLPQQTTWGMRSCPAHAVFMAKCSLH